MQKNGIQRAGPLKLHAYLVVVGFIYLFLFFTNFNMSEDSYSTQVRCSLQVPWGIDGWTDKRMKGKGGVKVEGVLEEREKIILKVK